jgi:flagellar hook-length control protein FliK
LLNSGFTTEQVRELYQTIAGIVPALLENQNSRSHSPGPVEAKNSTHHPILPPNLADNFASLGEIKNTGTANQLATDRVFLALAYRFFAPSTNASSTTELTGPQTIASASIHPLQPQATDPRPLLQIVPPAVKTLQRGEQSQANPDVVKEVPLASARPHAKAIFSPPFAPAVAAPNSRVALIGPQPEALSGPLIPSTLFEPTDKNFVPNKPNEGTTAGANPPIRLPVARPLTLETSSTASQPVGLDKAIISSSHHLAPETAASNFSPINNGKPLVPPSKASPALPPVFSGETAQPLPVELKPILTEGHRATTSTVLSDTSFKLSEDLVIKPLNGRATQLSLGVTEKLPNPDRLFSAPALKNQPTPPQLPVQLQEFPAEVEVTRAKGPVVEKLSFKEGPASRSPTSTSFTPNAVGTSEPGTMNSSIKAQIVAPAVNPATTLAISNPETIKLENETTPPGTHPVVDGFVSAVKGGKAEPLALPSLAREVSANNVIRQIANQFSAADNKVKGEIQLKLDPPSLGAVRLRVVTQGDSIRALIIADHHAVKQLIENNLPQLRDAINGQGLKVESFSVLVGGQSHQENPFANPDEKTFNTFAQNGNEESVTPGSETPVTTQPDFARQSSINIFA